MRHTDRAIAKRMEPMLNITEASRLLHVHPNTLRRWSDRGIIKTYRIGVRADRRYWQDDIARFLAQIELNGGDTQKIKMV
ncbi:helix-turn-helix domain-containing protein [Chloroflexota bacterium]